MDISRSYLSTDMWAVCITWFLFSLLSFSQVINFFKWKHHLFHSNDDIFTQSLFLNKKRCKLMTFSWRNESERKKNTNSVPMLALNMAVMFCNQPWLKSFAVNPCNYSSSKLIEYQADSKGSKPKLTERVTSPCIFYIPWDRWVSSTSFSIPFCLPDQF